MTEEFDIRPWGNYLVLSNKPNHKVKRITVSPGSRLSLQKHEKRQEHWYFVSGQGEVTIDEKIIKVTSNEAVDIPLTAVHRVANTSSSEDLVFIEIQTGEYFGEDDIIRLEDDYNRN